MSVSNFLLPAALIDILLLQRHSRLAVLWLPFVLLENAVDLLVDGFDAVLLEAELAVGDARSVLVGEVEAVEGLGSSDELGSGWEVVGAERRVVRVGDVDFGEVGGEVGPVTDSHLSIKIIKEL